MKRWTRLLMLAMLVGLLGIGLAGCGDDGDDGINGINGIDGIDGTDGADGADGEDGLPGSAIVDVSTTPESDLEGLEIDSEITNVEINSPPVVTFKLSTADGRPVIGMVGLAESLGERDATRFVRFTITKLVPGTDGDPDKWVAYTRDETGDGSTGPDYDTGSIVDNGDGTYTFTFDTDLTNVSGVTYDPTLTHRVAGQIGDGDTAFEPQNLVYDFVPNGGEVTNTRNIAVMESCNECHDNLVFHGRRFEVEYCVQCHNPELAEGEGDMAYMTHKIHAAGTFDILDDAIDYSEVTYPQELANCRKCHSGDDEATADGDNWKTVPSEQACFACHNIEDHPLAVSDNSGCATCHSAEAIEEYHTTPNATENNPNLYDEQREITYEVDSAVIEGGNLTITFRALSDGEVIDLANLPADLTDGPNFRLAYALPQSGISEPADFNNLGESEGQPLSLGLDGVVCDAEGCTLTVADPFPEASTMRTVAMQDYFHQIIPGAGEEGGDLDVSLHTQSAVVTVTGDTPRREIVSSAKCAACHEIFEGHGGNRVFTAEGGVEVCMVCHVPNLSSSGRTLDLNVPEDAQNMKDMIHGIHASAVRMTDYEHVRNFRDSNRPYNWSEVTFPAGVGNCNLCHIEGTNELPLDINALETTVRTTGVDNGNDVTTTAVATARDSVPNATDWVNSPVASSCFYCHDSPNARLHMEQNGATLSVPDVDEMIYTNRDDFVLDAAESCVVCHGDGKIADVSESHDMD